MGTETNQSRGYLTLYNDPSRYEGVPVDPGLSGYTWKDVAPAFAGIKNRDYNIRYDPYTGKVLGYYEKDRLIPESEYGRWGIGPAARKNSDRLADRIRPVAVQQSKLGGVLDYWGIY